MYIYEFYSLNCTMRGLMKLISGHRFPEITDKDASLSSLGFFLCRKCPRSAAEVLLITKATWASISRIMLYFVVRETAITEICLKEFILEEDSRE